MENEVMNTEEVIDVELEPEIEETETKDLTGLICFGLGVAATFAGKYAVKGAKKLVQKIKNKKASKESENEDSDNDDAAEGMDE